MFPDVRRLLIDVTHTAMGDTDHGIQRVTRNIASQALEYSQTHPLTCIPVIYQEGRFIVVDDNCIARGFRKTHSDRIRRRKQIARWIPFPLKSVGGKIVTKIRKILYPKTFLRKLKRLLAKYQRQPVEANPGPGDYLLLPDAWWCIPMFDALAEARRNGAIVGTMIQDLIPVQNPEYCDDAFSSVYRSWIDRTIRSVDFILGNSKTTRDALWKFIKTEHAPLSDWQVRHVRLGCDIESHRLVDERRIFRNVRDRYANRDTAPYLMVSTIEIRKNHKLLIDVFEELWRQGSDVSVAFVGRIGWKCDELVHRIKNHPEYGRRLLLYTDIDDGELDYIYQKSKAFLFPSLAEGFGLPIAEALHYRLNVFASNLAIHQEVGGPLCSYFSPHDSSELVQQLQHFEARKGWQIPTQPLIVNHSWAKTFENIVEECKAIAASSRQNPPTEKALVA